ncbi:DUF465 domain-containing protein [Sphingomonas sp.]|uniref:DUF465 domain-containing protein n=1 Tax=Sphingomonas sp. TaxID=28214 RepID=UPI003B3B481B
MNSLIERLITTHRMLNHEIRRELKRRIPDSLRLADLKKRRLAVKDQLFRHRPQAGDFRAAARQVVARFRSKRPANAL